MTITREQFDALGVSVSVSVAADALGISEATAYRLIDAGEFPVRVVSMGRRYVVPTQSLREHLGISPAIASQGEIVERLDRLIELTEALVRLQHSALVAAPILGVVK